ncbi:MAG: thiol peroxidase [Propionibacteriaceae bacterium]|jgi:thiol peroxidase|nr:thiol peroxidase [Propionibacteriaceae bacterium]
MASVTFGGHEAHTIGNLPGVGAGLPPFVLTAGDLSDITDKSFPGRRLVLNIFPSLDTATCALSVRRFNTLASAWPDTTVICASQDLPFAQSRFCAAEGIEHVVAASAFRSSFGRDYGLTLVDGPLRGLLARAVVVADSDGTVVYTDLVDVIENEPDYDRAQTAVLG